MPDVDIRIGLYRRLSALRGEGAVADFADELTDRFGPAPGPVRNLLALTHLRERCRGLGISRLEAGPRAIAVIFRDPETEKKRRAGLVDTARQLSWRDARLVYSSRAMTPRDQFRAARKLLSLLAPENP